MDPKEHVHNTDWLINTRLKKSQRNVGAGSEKGQGNFERGGWTRSLCVRTCITWKIHLLKLDS